MTSKKNKTPGDDGTRNNKKRKQFLLTILSTMLLGKRKEQRESLSTMLATDRVKHVCLGRKPMRNYNTMLHMKLNSAVCLTALLAFLPSSAFAGICFLPDCMDEDVVQGDINMNINSDTEYCEKEGYTYYSSGECPQYYAKIETCSRDDHYLKCDAKTWCEQNGYKISSCALPSFVNNQCPNGYPLYQGCKEDSPRACREQGYVNSCSPGRLYATSNRCPYDSSYGKCCTASPSSGCPSNYGVDCTGSASGTDACGYTCYRCCSDTCSSGSKNYSGSLAGNYSGSLAGYTECGTPCYRCKDCTSGSTSYSGSYVGSSECGSCYACSDTCRTGSKSVSCSSSENKVRVSSTECGSSCYSCQYNSDCSVSSKSCTYGCASYNSCGKCTSCESAPACTHSSHVSCTYGCATYCPCCSACKSCKSAPVNNDDDNTSSSGGGTCTDTCSSKGYSSSKPSGQTCSTTTVCGKTCYYNCKSSCTDTCSSKGYSSSKPSGQTCSTTTVCGKTCYYNCKTSHTHSYSCPSGYQSSSCGSGYTQSGTTSKKCSCGATSGTCYKCTAHTHSYSCPGGYQSSPCSRGSILSGTASKKCSCGATSGTCYKCKTAGCSGGAPGSACACGGYHSSKGYAAAHFCVGTIN